jgi:hypothetical protein
MLEFILQCEPRFVKRPAIRNVLTAEVKALRSLGNELLADTSWEPDDADAARGESAIYGALGSALDTAAALVSNEEGEALRALSERAAENARKLEELAVELDARERAEENADDSSGWEGPASPAGFDVAAVFSDF